MKKILWLSHEVDMGGANRCLAEQMQILAEAGYDISVVVLRKGSFAQKVSPWVSNTHEVYFYGWIIDLGKRIRPLHFIKRVLRNTKAVLQIAGIILRTRPDYVATNTVSIPVAAIAAKLTFQKHIWFIHEFGEQDHGYRLFCGFKTGARLINWLSEKIVFNSEAVKKNYQHLVPPSKQYIAHNPVFMPENENTVSAEKPEYKDSQTPLQCLILGQVAPSKNQMEALKAIDLLTRQGIDVRLKIVGNVVNFSYLDELNDFISKHHLTDKVQLLEYTESPFGLMRQADVYLMCSRMEAFGRVSVEALKLGVPVIAADSGGSPEIVEDGVNGYLYRQGSPESLAKRIQEFLISKDQFDREQIAGVAQYKFNAHNTREQLIKIFE